VIQLELLAPETLSIENNNDNETNFFGGCWLKMS
jgi:hypothetical protein